MRRVVLVPVKDHDRAKQRLAPILSAQERACLAWTMFEDVVGELRLLRFCGEVVFVTDSAGAASRACEVGWRVLREEQQISQSTSVDRASRELALEGVEAILMLPADLPLLKASDVEVLLEVPVSERSAVLVPSLDRLGTNAILRAPPDLFPSRFGRNSLVLHCQEAMRARADLTILENERIALDLDDATDVLRFMSQASDTGTYRLLCELGIAERLSPLAS